MNCGNSVEASLVFQLRFQHYNLCGDDASDLEATIELTFTIGSVPASCHRHLRDKTGAALDPQKSAAPISPPSRPRRMGREGER